MKDRVRPLVRRLASFLHGSLTSSGSTHAKHALAGLRAIWRTLRLLHQLLCCKQPEFLIVLDGSPRLGGLGSITGWTVSRGAKVVQVEALIDGQVIAASPPTEQRQDVARRLPSFRYQGRTGFRLAPSPDLLPDGRYPLCLRAHDNRGRTIDRHDVLEVRDYQLADRGELPGHLQGSNREYQHWIRRHESQVPPHPDCNAGPLISVVMPIFRPNLQELKEAIASVQRQWNANWELCLCDDGSRQSALTHLLSEYVNDDPRIRWVSHHRNTGIAAATNSAIGLASGEYVAFLDQDDRLAPDALHEVAHAARRSSFDLLYTDEDRIDCRGCRADPFFKPDWSPDLLLSMMYIAHLCVYRRQFLEDIGLLRAEFDGAQDWELALRAAARTDRIVHVPKILYHWRIGGNSAGGWFNRVCRERGRRACAEALQRQGVTAAVTNGPSSCTFHVRYQHPHRPLVSVLIPSRDNLPLLQRCLQSVRRRTDYPRYEIIIIDNGSSDPATVRFLHSSGERVLRVDEPFNHSRLNNRAARTAAGDLLLLLNDDTEVIDRGWMAAMVEQALRPEVGAVGALLLHPDDRIQHAGVILGLGPVATPLHSGITRDGLDRGFVRLIHNVSAVSGACLMIRRELYLEVGGLDDDELPTSFNDVDLCLRLRKAGYRSVCTPLARLYHQESASRDVQMEEQHIERMQQRWGEQLSNDPHWNVNLPQGPTSNSGFAFRWRQQSAAPCDNDEVEVSGQESQGSRTRLGA